MAAATVAEYIDFPSPNLELVKFTTLANTNTFVSNKFQYFRAAFFMYAEAPTDANHMYYFTFSNSTITGKATATAVLAGTAKTCYVLFVGE